jgi:hypothetical protein
MLSIKPKTVLPPAVDSSYSLPTETWAKSLMPIARAAAGVRSMTRPGTNGPLSLMVTRTDLPLRLLVTRAREPSRLQTKKPNHRHDSLLCARRYRPCCRCTDNRFDEVAASHVAHSCSRSGEILFEPVPKRHGSWPGLKVRSGLRTCRRVDAGRFHRNMCALVRR